MNTPGTLSLDIKDEAGLHAAYMPWLKGAGLFLATPVAYPLGSEITLLLQLPDGGEELSVAGRVVWVTPPRAQGARVRGIGIQFMDPGNHARRRLDTTLAGRADLAVPTHTM